VFLTGYDVGSIDARFAGAPILTKPIDELELGAILAGLFETKPKPAALAD
jgi:hypothetical protein